MSIANQRREFCEGNYDMRIICEDKESVDSIARRAIAVANWYHRDKGMHFKILCRELSNYACRVEQLHKQILSIEAQIKVELITVC